MLTCPSFREQLHHGQTSLRFALNWSDQERYDVAGNTARLGEV
jgi:hypothetical protein